jgi:DNA-binding transcriptional regulator YbjK
MRQPKRCDRRELLADAATEVLAREGSRGLTHRAVDREARVPEGTTKNYHPSRESLLVAIATRMVDQHRDAVRRLREQTPANVTWAEVVALYAAMLRRIGSSQRSLFLALFELHLEAVRRPAVRAALGEMTLASVDSAVGLHAAAGVRLGRLGGGLLEAGLLGLALSLISLPESVVTTIGFDEIEVLGRSLLSLGVVGELGVASGVGAVHECAG